MKTRLWVCLGHVTCVSQWDVSKYSTSLWLDKRGPLDLELLEAGGYVVKKLS